MIDKAKMSVGPEERPDARLHLHVTGDLPDGGSDGQVLTKQGGKAVWADPPAGGGGSGTPGAPGEPGEDGGYYIPHVSDNGDLSWTPSNPDMPVVPEANIKGKDGLDGKDGADGASGVYVGPEEPDDTNVNVWIDPDGVPDEPNVSAQSIEKALGYVPANAQKVEQLSEEIGDIASDVEDIKKTMNVEEYITVVGWGNLKKNGGYLNKSGNVVAHATYITSDYIPAIPGTDIAYTDVLGVGQYPQIAAYDAEKTYMPTATLMNPAESGAGIRTSGTYTIPEGVAYFRIVDDSKLQGYFTYKQVQEDENANPWNGKVWHAFGTSITDTTHINGETGEPTGQYVPYLAEMSGLGVVNHGIAGGTLGKGGTHGGSANILSAILSADLSGADLITIEGFVNDYACAVDIGAVGDDGGTDSVMDTSAITLSGALYRAIKHCLENSNATVILITDSTGREFTLKDGSTVNYTVSEKNSLNKVQNEYNQAIVDVARYMGVRVIDAGGKSQIGQFCPEYLADHIHHSALGGKQYATVIWDELKTISPRVKSV